MKKHFGERGSIMSRYTETKFKECPPAETVGKIKEILDHAGIKTKESFTESGVGTVSSVRVSIEGSDIGQNGKGTDRDYALASGYAEFMERLQTGLLYQFDKDTLSACMGVPARFPDEQVMTLSEAVDKGGNLLKETFRHIHVTDGGLGFLAPSVLDELEKWSFANESSDKDRFVMVPYENLFTGEKEWMAETVGRAYYFTNGSCAGNTKKEALIQGLSEIAERYATEKIMTGKLTPPVIPDEKLREVPPLWNIIEQMRGVEGYRLRVIDASCGKGLPVVGTILTDMNKGKMLIRFGAHPRFETALERCLTEMMQGRHIHRLEHTPEFDLTRDKQAGTFENRFNFAKAACGFFPSAILGSEASWEYKPFEEVGESTGEQYDFMLQLFSKLSFTPYVRDCSFLGFPTFHIIVPGVSMVFDFGSQRFSEKQKHFTNRDALRNLRTCSQTERNNVLSYVYEKRGWMLENGFGYLSGVPCRPMLEDIPMDADVIAALILMGENDYKQAANLLKGLLHDGEGNVTFAMPLAQAAMLTGNGSEVNVEALEAVYRNGWGKRAMEIVRKPLEALPVLTCPDCVKCPHAAECAMPLISGEFKQFFETVNS